MRQFLITYTIGWATVILRAVLPRLPKAFLPMLLGQSASWFLAR